MLENADHWTPPDSLGYSSLRPVRLTGQGKALVVVSVCLLVGASVLGVFLHGKARRQHAEQQLLRAEGRTTDATVTRAWIAASKEQERWISYRFEQDGRIYTHRVQTPHKLWESLSEGSIIPVRYAASRPEVNHPAAWEAKILPLWLAWLVGGMVAAAAFVPLIPIRYQGRLLTEGRPAKGRITGFKKAGKESFNLYEFRLLNGATVKGKQQAHRALAEGTTVCVLYDPENPRRNALYPLNLVSLEGAPRRAKAPRRG